MSCSKNKKNQKAHELAYSSLSVLLKIDSFLNPSLIEMNNSSGVFFFFVENSCWHKGNVDIVLVIIKKVRLLTGTV